MRLVRYITVLFFFLLEIAAHATVYQAENAIFFKAVTETKNNGYLGDSYINFDNETGSWLEIKIGMQNSGEQIVTIRFANGTTAARPMEIRLNDNVISGSFDFKSTGSWTNWDTISFRANFNEGVNILRCTSLVSEGGPNLDQFEITGDQAQIFSLNLLTEGSGKILHFPENGPFFEGEEITLVAKPDYNTVFTGWTGDFKSEKDSLKFIIDSNKSVTAHFVEVEYTLPEPDFSMIGYAAVSGDGLETTTGGEGGKVTVIETLSQLVDWGASREDNSTAETVLIKGKIEAAETTVISVKRGGNISILGYSGAEGSYGELKNISLNIRQYSNVIVRNLKMHEVFYPDDDLTIDECHHVWIDHCEFYSKIGSGITVDTYDGLLDIKKGSHNVTVSWCWFHDHMKTVLIGHSDNNGEQDINLEVTFHHNRFSNTDGRNPSLRFGKIHYFNNYLENITDYGIAVRNGAHAKIENCHFESVNIPVATDKFEGHGYACISDCIYTGSCSELSNEISAPFDCEFWNDQIPYSYNPESITTLKASVINYAGVGIINPVTSVSEIETSSEFLLNNVYYDIQSSNLILSLSVQNRQKLSFSLISIDGKTLLNKMVFLNSGKQNFRFPVSGLKHGIYIIGVESSNSRITRKLLF